MRKIRNSFSLLAALCFSLLAGANALCPRAVYAMQGSETILNNHEISNLEPGDQVLVKTSPYTYKGVELEVKHSYHSSNPDVASVDQSGKVTALSEGYTILTVRIELTEAGEEVWEQNFPDEPLEMSVRFHEVEIYVSSDPFVYRLYNPNSGEHFYTQSENERDSLSATGWKAEVLDATLFARAMNWLSQSIDCTIPTRETITTLQMKRNAMN